MKSVISLLAGTLVLAATSAMAAGFQKVSVPDPADRPLDVGVWYPSKAPPPAEPNTPFGQALAVDGPIVGQGLPLIVISHGNQGWFSSHRDTAQALADAGFVVAAVTHTGDNDEDDSYPASRWMVDRPRHLSRIIDFMTGEWPGRAHLDQSRIGAFGFSAGGLTVLTAIGGVPNPAPATALCAAQPQDFACRLGLASELQNVEKPWPSDPRIKAAVIAAPGLGFAFDKAGLANVSIPLQLWGALDDDRVPYASNIETVARALPRPPELHSVAAGPYRRALRSCGSGFPRFGPRFVSTLRVSIAPDSTVTSIGT